MSRPAPVLILTLLMALLGAACADSPLSVADDSPVGSELFDDPQGSYTMSIDPDWTANHGILTADTEFWVVAEIEDAFAPNVNAITQLVDTGLSLEEYLEGSIANAGFFMADFHLVHSEIVDAASGQQLALMEYEGDAGQGFLHFLAVFVVAGNQAVVMTLTTPPETFEEIRESVEPYLLTLRATS